MLGNSLRHTTSRTGLFRLAATRGMATEKQLANKIVSTKNIMKITSSMKMVSAAKLKGDENRLHSARPFNQWSQALCGAPTLLEDATFDDIPNNSLIVPLTSDKGLCGGVNSYISRGVRDMMKTLVAADKGNQSIVVVGEKGRSAMRRIVGDKFVSCHTEVELPGTFALASALTAEILAAGGEYESIVLVNNKFINMATYTQQYTVIKSFEATGESESLAQYEFEPDVKDEVLVDLGEYLLCSQLYQALMESAASEQSARMAAMENATKNAGEMVDALTLQYNRARQSRITTELIEIISGAAALEG